MTEALGFAGSSRLESARPPSGDFGSGQWEILERIARGATLAELLLSIVNLVEHQTEDMLCSILLFDPGSARLRHGAARRLPADLCTAIDGMRIGPSEGSCGMAAFRRQRVVVTDIASHPAWVGYKHAFLAHGLRACWSTPILSPAGELLGTLGMYFTEARGPSVEECAWADAATHLAAIALSRARSELENERLLHTLGERVKELTLLHKSARLLQAPHAALLDQLEALVGMIPNGWRFPDECRARIRAHGVDVCTPGFVDGPCKQVVRAPAGEHQVSIEVVYLDELEASRGSPFLPEELTLLESLADLVGARIEKHAAELTLRAALTELEGKARLEAQTQRIRSLGTLAGGIAHDFNNILTAISGHAHLGLCDIEEERSPRDSLEAIQEASIRAVELVRRILTFSRHQEPERKACRLESIVEEALDGIAARLPRGVELQHTFAPRLPTAHVDAKQIQQVVLNLLANAADAVGVRGCIDVSVDVVPRDHDALLGVPETHAERYLRIAVSDTGVGMTDGIVEHIFEPFYSTKPSGQGTGLGLSVVHGIVKAHGGVVTVDSQPGKGSRFQVFLPDLPGAAAERNPERQPSRPPAPGVRVMYVDDEEPLVVLATRWLGRLGYAVTGFSDAARALEAFKARPQDFDAVISDFSMPGLSGLDLVRQVVAVRPDIIVVMSSGYVEPEDRQRALDLGAVDVVLKPQSMAEFGRILHRILSERQAQPRA
jgi:signal transduction histidine kinase/ActR/RegA family two-component response regulator